MAATDQKIKEKKWESVQIKAFTSWLNGYLSKRNLEISDMATQLDDGVRLINFLELLSEKRVKQKYIEKPPTRIQKIENLHIALSFLEKEMEVRSTASAENFADNNLTLILGFFWTLFKKYRIQTIKQDGESSEAGLLLWVKKTTDGYPDCNIESYKHSFRSGMPFLALCDKYIANPDVLNYETFSKENTVENLNKAFEIAEQHMGIPRLLDAPDVAEGTVDERSLVLYISLYFHAFVAQEQQKALLGEKDRMESEMKGLQGSLQDRAQRAQRLEEENAALLARIAELEAQLKSRGEEHDADKKRLEEALKRIQEVEERAAQLEKQLAEEKARHEKELADERARHEKELKDEKDRFTQLEEGKMSLEGQFGELQGQFADLTSRFETETNLRKSLADEHNKKSETGVRGLGVLKKNLEEHVEDLYRWQKFLNLDGESEVDFSGEVRPQLLLEISKENFDAQLDALAKKLEKENADLANLLKSKEAEQKVKAEQDKKKKQRQGGK